MCFFYTDQMWLAGKGPDLNFLTDPWVFAQAP